MDDAKTWDALAGRYDAVIRVLDRSYPAIEAGIARDLAGRERVLECAAGTGQFTPALARVATSLLATDVSPEMVRSLQARVQVSGAPHIETRVLSAYDTRLPSGHFDAVFCANALHVMTEPERALAELRRVLRDDGRLVAPTFLHGVDSARRLFSRALSFVSPFVAHTRYDLRGLCGAVAAAGFEIADCRQLPGPFPIGYVVADRRG